MMVMPMMISEPAPSPWMARKAISWAMVCDSPESAEPTRNRLSPTR